MVNTMDNESLNDAEMDEPLGRVNILSYGSGHMLNDITSSCWFTYLLVFLTDIGLSPRYVSFLLYSLFSYRTVDCILELLNRVELVSFTHSH
jgi:Na+/melibiose symporter-like transporter